MLTDAAVLCFFKRFNEVFVDASCTKPSCLVGEVLNEFQVSAGIGCFFPLRLLYVASDSHGEYSVTCFVLKYEFSF